MNTVYANSLLVTLNSRRLIRKRTKMGLVEGDHAMPVMFPSFSDEIRARSRARFGSVSRLDDLNVTCISKIS